MDTAASVGFSFQTSSGAGFAIPINDVLTIAGKILAGKASAAVHIGKTAIIGVYVAQDTVESVAGANCPAADANTAGTLVEGVVSGSPATGTGIGKCDLIETLNGADVSNPTALLGVMETYHPGNQATLRWKDSSGASHSATMTLATGQPN